MNRDRNYYNQTRHGTDRTWCAFQSITCPSSSAHPNPNPTCPRNFLRDASKPMSKPVGRSVGRLKAPVGQSMARANDTRLPIRLPLVLPTGRDAWKPMAHLIVHPIVESTGQSMALVHSARPPMGYSIKKLHVYISWNSPWYSPWTCP